MDERTLRVLEFEKIVKRLEGLATCELGREYIYELKPQRDIKIITKLLDETSAGTNFILRRGSPPMGGIHDIRSSLKRLEIGAVFSPAELLRTADTLRLCRNLKSYSSEGNLNDSDNPVSIMISSLQINKRLEDKIQGAIISEEEISDHASPTLNTIRRKIRDLQASIKDKLNEFVRSQKYQKFMQDSIVTLRGDRYVVPVKQECRSEVPGLVHDASSSGATVFIEPMAVVEANNDIKAARIKEQIEIERILQELTADVSSMMEGLRENMEILGKLDFIFAKAKLSLDLKSICPKINIDNNTIIKKGRHPLLDPKVVVPIDLWIGRDFKTLVVTGPNTGGKTVTLKTLGLFTLMAQAGLHVPANEGTEIAVFDKVFADIGDEQSIEQSLSTFSSHMKNIVGILQKVDDNTLALFDELGAGTDPVEGAALAMSILEYLHQTGTITTATTHYSELKIYALTTKGVENASCEFDVETLKPTYRLLIGVPGKSNAFAISRKLGLSDNIIERAKEFITQEDVKFEDLLLSIDKNRAESEKERMRAESYRREAETLKQRLDDENRRLEIQKEKFLREARENSRKILLEAKKESEDILLEMRRLMRETQDAEARKAAEEIKGQLKSKIDAVEEALVSTIMPKIGNNRPRRELKPGDSVLIVNLNQKGFIITPPGKDDEAIVQAGIMKINVHISNLKLIDEQKAVTQKTGAGKIGISKAKGMKTEVDIRGMNLDEGTDKLDKYLDDASIAGLGVITVIHGKGTGILRNGIQQFLKNDARVKSYRLGELGEGDTGVTVVEMA
jgi:DNA mismatch repair protein MutS2